MTDQLPQKSLTAPIPKNETQRLAALHRYQILDTPPEAAFDRITTLAARLFDMPIALISLVDESRAWFKSCIGFAAREVPRDATLCSFAVLTEQPLIIPDTRLDERFACNPFVQSEPGVRFYAGAPLLSHDGFNLGTLCLLDTQPRDSLTAEQQATLVDLAAMVVDELELRLAAQKIAQVDAALLEITQGVATVTGEAFFAALVQHFAQVLDADYAYIGLVEGDEPKMLRTLTICAHGQIVDNLEYLLQDTPCWEVIEQRKICCYRSNVQAHFPNAPLLKQLEVESYVAIPFFNSSGTPLGLLGVMDGKPLENVQLAESLLATFALRIATELERQLFEQERERFLAVGSDLQVIMRIDGYFQWVSPSFERLLGWTVKEMTSRPWADFVHPEDISLSASQTDGLFCGNKTLAFENRYRHKDGSYRWLLWKAELYSQEQLLYGAAVDITQRKQVEQALRQSEARVRLAIEIAQLGTWRYDLGTNLVELDGRMCEIWDEKEHSTLLPLLQVMERIHPNDRPQVTSAISAALDSLSSGNYQIDYRIVWNDGTERWISANGQVIFVGEGELRQAVEFLGTALDITERKWAEQALRKSEEQSRNILESIDDGFFALNENWRFTYVNQSAEALLARASGDLIGKDFWQEFPGLSGSEFEQLHRGVMRERVAGSLTAFYPDHERWYEVRTYPAANGITIYFRNVTEQIQTATTLRQSEERYRTLFESIDEGFCIVEILLDTHNTPIDYRLLEVNPTFEQQTGLQQAVGKTARQLNLEERWIEIYGQVALTGKSVRFENGSEVLNRWFDVYACRTGEPEARKVAIVFKDISDRKRIEAEREQILQREQTAREAAERANQIKNEFLAVLSHELRSPLNPILGWTRLLLNGKLDPTRQTEALKTIERNAKLQTQLIEDLLDISRIMQGKLSLTVAPVSLTFVISAALETVRLAAEAKNIAFALDIDPKIAPISGDAVRLQQVMWNLLTNTVKFTPNGGQVTIEVRQLAHLAQIRVIDTGKGINPQFLPYVFEYFRQEDGSTTRRFGGLGLGLAIVRQVVELHGGTVKAESRGENQGATFIVQLPLMQQATSIASEPTHTQTDTKAPLDNIQILLVDDEQDTREFQAFLLEQSGAKVTAVASGLEALQVLDKSVPDVLVSDLGMPDMDGYMLIEQIRSRLSHHGGAIVALALTAYAAEVDQQRAIRAGFQAFVTKPVQSEKLVKVIISLLDDN